MISNKNTIHNSNTSAAKQKIGINNVRLVNADIIHNGQKCVGTIGGSYSRKMFQDISNRYGESFDRRLKPSPIKSGMSEFEPKINITPASRSSERSNPSVDNFNYSQSYLSNSLSGSSFNRSATSDDLGGRGVGIGKCKRPRKARSIFSTEQLKILNEEFERHNYINNYTREELANRAGITPEQVKIWFQNMRSKRRKSFERAVPYNLGLDYATIQHFGNINSINPQGQLVPHIVRGQPSFANPHSSSSILHPHSGSLSGSNSSNSSTTYNYGIPGGSRVANGHNNSANVNMSGLVSNNQPTVYWESSNKNHPLNPNKNSGFVSTNNNQLSFNSTNTNHQTYGSQQLQNYPSKDSHTNNGSTTNSVNAVATNHLKSSNNKSSNFIAPGFASTLYNAKLSSEAKISQVDRNKNQMKSSPSFVLNRPSIDGDQINSTAKQYATSTPQHRNNGQLNANNFYNNSLPPVNNTANGATKPKMYPSKSTVSTNITQPTQQQSYQTNGSNMRPKH